jgi:hypothetical protein
MKRLRSLWSGVWYSSGLTLAFIALVALMLAAAAGLSRVSGWIPLIVLSATLVLLLWQLAVELLAARSGEPGKQGSGTASGADRSSRRASRPPRPIGGCWCVADGVAGATVFSLAWLRWHARERWGLKARRSPHWVSCWWLVFGQILVRALPASRPLG